MLAHPDYLDAFAGVFVPHFVSSIKGLSHGAKILYSLLRSQSDRRGETLLNAPLATAIMGEEEKLVYRLLAELETGGFVLTVRHPLGTEFVRCSFPALPSATLKSGSPGLKSAAGLKVAASTSPKRQNRKARARAARTVHGHAQSRFTREECTSYALACEAAGHNIRSPFGFGLSLYQSGNQDREIELFLQTGEVRKASAA